LARSASSGVQELVTAGPVLSRFAPEQLTVWLFDRILFSCKAIIVELIQWSKVRYETSAILFAGKRFLRGQYLFGRPE